MLLVASGLMLAPATSTAATIDAWSEIDPSNSSSWAEVPAARMSDQLGFGLSVYSDSAFSEGSTLTGVRVSVTLPTGAGMAPDPADPSCAQVGQVVTCNLPDVQFGIGYVGQPFDVSVAEPGRYRFVGEVNADGTVAAPIESQVLVVATGGVDLTGSAWAHVVGDGDVPPEFGEPFRLVVEADDVFVLDTPRGTSVTTRIVLPSGLSFARTPYLSDALDVSSTDCAVEGSIATCVEADFERMGLAFADVSSAAPGTYRIRVEYSSTGVELDPADNVIEHEVRVDACYNLDGYQPAVPPGMVFQSWGCIDAPVPPVVVVDVCANLAGVQPALPAGTWFALGGACRAATAGPDALRGDAGPNVMSGGRGNDQLFGMGGNDRIDGGIGADRLDGGDGLDVLLGGAGNDALLGGRGRDVLVGGPGNDVVRARDGVAGERITCGAGHDTALVDRRDLPARDCEVVRRG